MKKRLISMLLVLCMVLSFVPTAVFAAEAELTVTDANGGAVDADENGKYQLADDEYTISGAGDSAIVINGDATVTLNGAEIVRTKNTQEGSKFGPAIDVENGDVTLVLSGESSMAGSPGYAGIHVAEGASLTIEGKGTLTAIGGDGSGTVNNTFGINSDGNKVYFGSGAGIGGNGIWMTGSDNVIDGSTANFGTITIQSGSVNATGGMTKTANAGGGAGIGGGGNTTKAKSGELVPEGSVVISGGVIEAIGGDGCDATELSGGGAGIGVGGATGGWYTASNNVTVEITAGNVTATGMADGAGIGGGANVDGGEISISGGTVTANGGYEIKNGAQSGGFGGAGIGGGDNGGVTSITISGGTVTARATGAAAGIGAGNSGELGGGEIEISGDADVTAYGGAHATRAEGGAGIGGGRSNDYDSGFKKITISGNATVKAYAGAGANAIGVGTYYGGDDANEIEFGSDATVAMFTKSDVDCYYGQSDAPKDGVISYAGEFPAANTATATTVPEGETWQHNGNGTISIGEDAGLTVSYDTGYDIRNWAVTGELAQDTNVYCYFLTVDADGDTIVLSEDEEHRAGLYYYEAEKNAPDNHWYVYGKLVTQTKLSGNYDDATAEPFRTVIGELKGENFAAYKDNTEFVQKGYPVTWGDLNYHQGGFSHAGYHDEEMAASYHMDGTVTFYDVTFEANADGEIIEGLPESGYYVDGAVIELPNLKRNGYRLSGWSVDGAEDASEKYTVNKNVTLTAQWEPEEATITYNMRVVKDTDVVDLNNPTTYDANDLPITLSAPNLKNNEWPQKFLNWRDAEGNVVSEITEFSGDLTLYAYWQFPVKYTVYDENGDVIDSLSTTEWFNDGENGDYTIRVLDEAGHDFDGWYQKPADIGNANKRVASIYKNTKFELFGKLTRKSYTMVGTLQLNGETVMVADGRYQWSDRFTGLYGDEVDFTQMLEKANARLAEVDAANEPAKFEITITNPGSTTEITQPAHFGQGEDLWWRDNNNCYVLLNAVSYYEVSFDTEGGTEIDAQIVKSGDMLDAFEAPEKTGYTFVGWTLDGEDFDPEKDVITHKSTLVAQWSVNQYTITFDTDGGTEIEPITQYYDTEITAPEDPTKTGYTFKGWEPEIPATMPAENLTVKAQWQINQYTITFDTDGGTEIAPITQDYGTAIEKPADPTKTGYKFLGWDTEIPETMPAEDMTIKAMWEATTYTVAYHGNGGKLSSDSTKDKTTSTGTIGQALTLKNADTFVREHYDFVGWATDPDATEATYTGSQKLGEGYPGAEAGKTYDLYAVWKKHVYTVAISASLGGEKLSWIANANVTVGENLLDAVNAKLDELHAFQQKSILSIWEADKTRIVGYHADREHLYSDEAATEIAGDALIFDGTTELVYINYLPNTDTPYTVEHYQEQLDGTYALVETENLTGTTDTEATATDKGYTGFTVDETVEGTLASGNIAGDGSLVLALYYKRNVYDVTFVSDGETFATQQVKYGATATEPNPAPTKAGYDLDGWYLDDEAFNFTTAIEGNIQLTAKWTARKDTHYKVRHVLETLNPNHPWETKDSDELKGETDTTVTAKPRTSFKGFTFDEGNENNVTSGVVKGDGSLVLTLYYVRNIYNVTFDLNGGNVGGSTDSIDVSVKYEASVGAEQIPQPERAGYDFVGWYTEADGETEADLTAPVTEDVKVYAKWTARSDTKYTIHYYIETLDGKWEKNDSYYGKGTTDTEIDATTVHKKSYEHFTLDLSVDGTVASGTIAGDGSLVLKLFFKRNVYEVTFVSDGETFETQQVKYGATATEPNPAPTKAGYDLDGWYLDDEAFDFTTAIEGDIQLTAKWTARDDTKYTVEHYQEQLNGTYVLADTDNLEGTTDTEAVAAEKSYDDFTVDKTVEGTVASGNIAGDGSLVLKLYYTRNTYSYEVRHIKQLPDGTYDEANAEVENLSGKFEAIATVNAKDYGSHYPVNDADEKQNVQIEKGLVIEVHYDLDEHTLTFDAKGGTETDSVTVRHGNTVAKPEDPKRSGYRFTGWFDDEKCKEAHDFDAPLEEDATVYAGWRKRSTDSGVQTESPNKPKADTSLKFNTEEHFAYVNGYPDGTVRPEGKITRAEVAAILYRIMDEACVDKYKTNSSSYKDVARSDWFNTYVATLENAGVIVDTKTGGNFRPNEAITRAELATMLAQFATTTTGASNFNDVAGSHWASREIAIAAKMGWINGYPDGSFRPDQTITRAEMMAMVNRALERTPESEDDLLSGMKTWSDNARTSAWYYLDVQEATNGHTYTKSGTHESWKKLAN